MVVAVHVPRLPLLVALLAAGRPMDRPVALGPPPGAPQVVGLCTPAAEAEGVEPGLRVGEALARCPSLDLVTPDPAAAADAAERVILRLEAIGARVEPGELGDACFEADGLRRLHGGLEGVLRRSRAALPVGAGGRVGAAPSRFAALQAAREAVAGRPLVIGPDEVAGFLAPLPAARLPLAPDLVRALADLGLRTVGQVAALPRAAALERLGSAGLHAWLLARGEPDRPLRPRTPPQPLEASMTFPDAVGALPALEAAGRLLLAELAGRARARGRALRGLSLRARLADGGSWTREVALREATGDPERLAIAALPRLADVTGPVATLTVAGDAGAPLGGRQLTAIPSGAEERRRRAGEAVRQVRAAAGAEALLRAVELEPWSRLPERRWALVPYDA
ncbi:MAG: protein ImuB [Miltoncostaeaceae bacterium]|nr:protein ImuB [Miltoncostaeaceae bacterium]